jgi:hypothetical protein
MLPIIQTNHHCGTCTMCCKVLGVTELEKPPQQWCTHCKIGQGCQVYADRPVSCVEFECVWLQRQDMPLELRPDKSRVVLMATMDGECIVALVDPTYAGAADKGMMAVALKGMGRRGLPVIIAEGDKRRLLYSSKHTSPKLLEEIKKFAETMEEQK